MTLKDFEIRSGLILLRPENIVRVSGEVEELRESWRIQRDLQLVRSFGANMNPVLETGHEPPPKFQPLELEVEAKVELQGKSDVSQKQINRKKKDSQSKPQEGNIKKNQTESIPSDADNQKSSISINAEHVSASSKSTKKASRKATQESKSRRYQKKLDESKSQESSTMDSASTLESEESFKVEIQSQITKLHKDQVSSDNTHVEWKHSPSHGPSPSNQKAPEQRKYKKKESDYSAYQQTEKANLALETMDTSKAEKAVADFGSKSKSGLNVLARNFTPVSESTHVLNVEAKIFSPEKATSAGIVNAKKWKKKTSDLS